MKKLIHRNDVTSLWSFNQLVKELGEFLYKSCSFSVFNIWFTHRIFYDTFYSVFSNKVSSIPISAKDDSIL